MHIQTMTDQYLKEQTWVNDFGLNMQLNWGPVSSQPTRSWYIYSHSRLVMWHFWLQFPSRPNHVTFLRNLISLLSDCWRLQNFYSKSWESTRGKVCWSDALMLRLSEGHLKATENMTDVDGSIYLQIDTKLFSPFILFYETFFYPVGSDPLHAGSAPIHRCWGFIKCLIKYLNDESYAMIFTVTRFQPNWRL